MKAPCIAGGEISIWDFGKGRDQRWCVKKCKVTIQRVLFLIFSFVISKETIRDVLLV